MANIVVTAGADGVLIEFTPTTGPNNWDEMEIIASFVDSSEITYTGNPTGDDMLILAAMPGDFDASTDFTLAFRSALSGVVDDTITMQVGLFESNETTQIGSYVSHAAGNHSYATTTGSLETVGDANAATWDTRRFDMQCLRSNSGMPDSIDAAFSAVEADINYDAVTSAPDEEFAATQAEKSDPSTFRPKLEVVSY